MGKIAKIFLVIFIVSTLASAGVAYYFYNFYVFKTLHIWIAQEKTDLQFTCVSSEECFEKVFDNADEVRASVDSAPGVIKERLEEVYDLAVICEETCKYREVYGAGFVGDENYVPCTDGDTEIKQEIKGMEALSFIGAAKDKIF